MGKYVNSLYSDNWTPLSVHFPQKFQKLTDTPRQSFGAYFDHLHRYGQKIYAAHGGSMTDLRQLLAHNMKERRRALKITQYRLAELAGTSAYYIGMIEAEKKYPSPEMMQKIAAGLGIDTPELFSMASSFPVDTIKKYQKEVLQLIKKVSDSVLNMKLEQLTKNP